jgi:VCBS repeat-containing protein
VEKSGNDAKVAIKDESGKSVKFVMRKKNGYWEIYRIDMTLEEIQELNKGESSTDTPSTPTTTE